MPTPKIGPTFPSELVAAGVALDGLSWSVDDGTIVAADGDAHLQAADAVLARHDPTRQPPPTVPVSVSNYQARAVLVQRALFAKVDAAIHGADMTVPANMIALQAWDYANDFYRASPIVAALAGILGLAPADVDALFVAAAAVT